MQTSFLLDTGIAVTAALVVSLLFYRLGLPMIVGQMVAGFLVGPYGLGLIRDTTAIDFLATLGIILLLFVIGLELDPRRFGQVGPKVLVLSTVELLVAFSISALSALSAGWDLGTALFLGSVLGLSSTAIVAKLMLDRFSGNDENFTALMMVLVMEDVVAVFLLFLTPELAAGGLLRPTGLLLIASKGVVLFFASFGFGRYIGPRLINKISQYEMEIGEVAFLLALSFGFLFGVFSDYLGFSPAIGALLVGFFMPVKHSKYVREKILPLKDAFIVFFFLSMGTLLDLSRALTVGLPLVIILAGAVIGKFIGGYFGSRVARVGRPLLVGSILVPRGEFSLVLAKTGVDAGFVGPELYPVAGLAVLATAIASPLFDKLILHRSAEKRLAV